ncbi:MAG: 5-oxoprolinase subunit PxpB [Clostridium sp.]|jgi:KipI family sensor histidine kinase inhibitor|nr:5-oxoprolinase subunit PxpB [Clostridium sp.]
MADVRFLIAGDSSLCAEFGNEISKEINAQIRAFNILLKESGIAGIVETIPTYRSLLIQYDPGIISYKSLEGKLKKLLARLDSVEIPPSEVLEVPVLYGGEEMGPDLKFVAENAKMSEEEVIKLHSEPEYLIYMLGFTPGFTYLGGLNDAIETPRLKTPRVKIPAGSVGIAGKQTGVYPIDSPGGWQLIGRTPLKMYDADREKPILPEAGQYIKFVPIDRAEFDRIAAEVEKGTYEVRHYPKKEA